MADPIGDKLYVNLSASQTRRRLKGFGHGVRKVQSAGRNQAVVIHTATGRHLQELEAKFADVGSRLADLTAEDKEKLKREVEDKSSANPSGNLNSDE
jgi:DNA transformation protein